jgi:hypothetical protein
MKTTTPRNLIQAYQQAPWRTQLQMIGWFSLGLLVLAIVASLYLNVSARASAVGRDVQRLQVKVIEAKRINADLEMKLAELTSSSAMNRRADALGFRPASLSNIVYIVVPDYAGDERVRLAPPPGGISAGQEPLPAEYTQTLFDFLRETAADPPEFIMEVLP